MHVAQVLFKDLPSAGIQQLEVGLGIRVDQIELDPAVIIHGHWVRANSAGWSKSRVWDPYANFTQEQSDQWGVVQVRDVEEGSLLSTLVPNVVLPPI